MGNRQAKDRGKTYPTAITVKSGTELILEIDQYQQWFDALCADDEQFIKDKLQTADKVERERLINGTFDFGGKQDEDKVFKALNETNFRTTRPLILSALFGSTKAVSCLVDNGAIVTCVESNGGNLLHMMVSAAHSFPQYEDDLTKAYANYTKIFSEKDVCLLLHAENPEGLRPLELAAKLGCCKIVRAFLETRGVYLTRETKRGMIRYQWIDVTEYETTDPKLDRRGKSPLGFLALMDEKTLMKSCTKDLFTWSPFKLWFKSKICTYSIFFFLWFLFRLSQMVVFILLSVDKSLLHSMGGIADEEIATTPNATYSFVFCSTYVSFSFSPTIRTALFVYMAVQGYFILLFDVIEVLTITVRKVPLFFFGFYSIRPNIVVERVFYRLNQFMMSLLFSLAATAQLTDSLNIFSHTGLQVINILCTINMTFSIMFFFQLLPAIGIYVITARRMLRDLISFGFLYLIWVTPFSLYFMVYFNTNSKRECVKEFSTVGESFYSTFLLMLNMLNLRDYDVYNVEIMDFVHVIYVFVVAVLLINFLIAVMSSSAARIALCDDVILRLERLHCALTIEVRINWILYRFIKAWKSKLMVVQNSRFYILNIKYG